MREHLFRGKTKTGEWVEGDLIHRVFDRWKLYEVAIKERNCVPVEVLPETVGEWSGLFDKNNKRIFEGDLFKLGAEKEVFEVRFDCGCVMVFRNNEQYGLLGELHQCFIDVIGNIYDNPELLQTIN